ncbi:hypothetical protein [Campylobacter sp. JMF_08 NE1]|uniref:hypothetical protein n=1 Tax=Campylobacter sp. JMF_08 NE1 TaxID=2983821 RepID=UPI0022E9A81C|nr:hypothetical protein [Campylobacter sp. JMF_08 NE1]MDA3047577.1 hypothetical protein [Campylobacter sp. JMF_08 NE1]
MILSIKTTADKSTIEAIKTLLLSIDPSAVFSFDEAYLSEEDTIKLKEIYDKNKKGELNFVSFDEMKNRTTEHLRKLGAKI